MSVIADSFRVAWIDMRFVRHNILSILVSCLIAPLLYLVAFGYGLGRGMTVDGYDYISFMIPGVIALSTLTSCFSTVSTKVMMQRVYYQSFDELFLCSMSAAAMVLGKAYAGVVRGLISASILYALGMFISDDMHLTVSAIVMIMLSCLVFSMLGVMCGMLANSHQTQTLLTSLLIMPMTFLCGTLFSLEALPGFAQTVIGLLPLTHTTVCIRSSILGSGLPLYSLLIVLIYGLIFFAVSSYVLQKGRK